MHCNNSIKSVRVLVAMLYAIDCTIPARVYGNNFVGLAMLVGAESEAAHHCHLVGILRPWLPGLSRHSWSYGHVGTLS